MGSVKGVEKKVNKLKKIIRIKNAKTWEKICVSVWKMFKNDENHYKNIENKNLTRDDFDGGPVSLDEIEKGLWLGKKIIFVRNKI